MKHTPALLALFIACLFFGCHSASFDKRRTVNPVIGDISFESRFGRKPDASTDNWLRVQTHLAYAEQLLRGKDDASLSPELRQKRAHLLDLLHTYWSRGRFPRNYDYAGERKPCFIDRDGTICAVGYLIEQTAGRSAADGINSRHQYDGVLAMNEADVNDWIATSGLSREECAIIQPTYGYYGNNPQVNTISREYGAVSAVAGGLSVSIDAINMVQLSRGKGSKAIPYAGIACGIGQILMGAVNMPQEGSNTGGYDNTNESKKYLCFINIGLGTTTTLLSAWNLLNHHPPKDRKMSWNIHSYETPGGNTGLALNFVRRF